ncbi:MAG: gliding motility-associated C-terminal domain-containing protein, partial [Agriterribacter sp.]
FVSDKAFIAGMPQHTYIAVVKDQNLCMATSKALIIPNIETKLNSPRVTDQDIPRNTAAIIAVINPQQGKYELLSDANGSTIIGVSDEGIFETALISEDRSFFIRYSKGDCSSELSALTIKVFDSTFIYVPNTFTPNRDGKNDVWRPIIYGKLNSFSISVYNRWGQIVYFSDNIKNTWDGTFKGNNLPAGLFLYSITAKDYRNKPVNIKGYVTIMR